MQVSSTPLLLKDFDTTINNLISILDQTYDKEKEINQEILKQFLPDVFNNNINHKLDVLFAKFPETSIDMSSNPCAELITLLYNIVENKEFHICYNDAANELNKFMRDLNIEYDRLNNNLNEFLKDYLICEAKKYNLDDEDAFDLDNVGYDLHFGSGAGDEDLDYCKLKLLERLNVIYLNISNSIKFIAEDREYFIKETMNELFDCYDGIYKLLDYLIFSISDCLDNFNQ